MPSPRKKSVQQWAHAFIVLSLFWILFSAWAFFDWLDTRRIPGSPNAIPDLVIWSLHLLFIGLACYFFKTEKKREVLWLGEDDEISAPAPMKYDLILERKRLASEFWAGLVQVPVTLLWFEALGIAQLIVSYLINSKVPDPIPVMIWVAFWFVVLLGRLILRTFYFYAMAVSRNQAYAELHQSQETSGVANQVLP